MTFGSNRIIAITNPVKVDASQAIIPKLKKEMKSAVSVLLNLSYMWFKKISFCHHVYLSCALIRISNANFVGKTYKIHYEGNYGNITFSIYK